jgi:hypothetical protein
VWHWTHVVKAGATSHGMPVPPPLLLVDAPLLEVDVVPEPELVLVLVLVLVGDVPASVLQLPIGVPEMIQSETVLICAAVASGKPFGGIGAVLLSMRRTAICAIVLVGSVGAGDVRSAYVTSDPTAPPTGGWV